MTILGETELREPRLRESKDLFSRPSAYEATSTPVAEKERISIVCFSGDFDRALAAFTIATGAATTNRKVTMFFTFWGLNIIKKQRGRRWNGRGIFARFFNFLLGGRNNLPLSRLNFAGLSPKLMTGMMKAKNVATLNEFITVAVALDVGLVACEMAMHILELKKVDLVDEVAEVIGVSTFLDRSRDAKVIFI